MLRGDKISQLWPLQTCLYRSARLSSDYQVYQTQKLNFENRAFDRGIVTRRKHGATEKKGSLGVFLTSVQ